MMKTRIYKMALLGICLFLINFSCVPKKESSGSNSMIFAKDNLVAWCIVPFDSENRTPEQRAKMLHDLGIRSLAWDWREEHVATLGDEIASLKKYGIELKAVWFWVDGSGETILNYSLEQLLETLENTNTHTELWVSFPASYFERLSEEEKIEKGIKTISYLQDKAQSIGCKIALYNHGDWFGDPVNQIKIIEGLEDKHVGLVYNFHHAHEQLDRYEELLQLMKPYLWTVNLNGMKKDGPKIIDLGKGEEELSMMQALIDINFQGSIGILGHTEGEDIEVVLKRNLEGLQLLLDKMGQQEALKTY